MRSNPILTLEIVHIRVIFGFSSKLELELSSYRRFSKLGVN
jgi:hypothetical protein